MLDLTGSFDFDQIIASKTCSTDLRDQTCLLLLGMIQHSPNARFEAVTKQPMLLMQNIVRIFYNQVATMGFQ
jgi:hypothetical protein